MLSSGGNEMEQKILEVWRSLMGPGLQARRAEWSKLRARLAIR